MAAVLAAADPGENTKYWRVLRREMRVEMVLRGAEPRRTVDVYEIFWTGGANGNWNATLGTENGIFFCCAWEGGKYHVVRDWWRSIFRVSGPHTRLPLDDSRPFWERVALMNWWFERGAAMPRPYFGSDPGLALTMWRTVKLLRGLVRHPDPSVRLQACRELIQLGWG